MARDGRRVQDKEEMFVVKQGMTQENVKPLFDSPFIRVADLQYAPGKHYYNASRRKIEDMV